MNYKNLHKELWTWLYENPGKVKVENSPWKSPTLNGVKVMSKFEVGMDVFDLRYGWGKVVDTDSDWEYGVKVQYPNIICNIGYSVEGKWNMGEKYPLLLLESEVPKEWLDLYPKPTIKREEIMYMNSYPKVDLFYIYSTEQEALFNKALNGITRKVTVTWEE